MLKVSDSRPSARKVFDYKLQSYNFDAEAVAKFFELSAISLASLDSVLSYSVIVSFGEFQSSKGARRKMGQFGDFGSHAKKDPKSQVQFLK